jgi:hypothetical protein
MTGNKPVCVLCLISLLMVILVFLNSACIKEKPPLTYKIDIIRGQIMLEDGKPTTTGVVIVGKTYLIIADTAESYKFQRWNLFSGQKITFEDQNSQKTKITIQESETNWQMDIRLEAIVFNECFEVSKENRTYNFADKGAGNKNNRIFFYIHREQNLQCTLQVSNNSYSSHILKEILFEYFGSDSSYRKRDSSNIIYGGLQTSFPINLEFGQFWYFAVRPVDTTITKYDFKLGCNCAGSLLPTSRFQLRIIVTYENLSIEDSTKADTGSIVIDSGDIVQIDNLEWKNTRLKLLPGFKVREWKKDTNAIISDTNDLKIGTVKVNGNAELEVKLIHGTVCTLSTHMDTLNIQRDYYETAPFLGIRLLYRSDANRGCTLFVNGNPNTEKFLAYVGTDSTFQDSKIFNKGIQLSPIVFSSDSGKIYYFRIGLQRYQPNLNYSYFDITTAIHLGPRLFKLSIDSADHGAAASPVAVVDSGAAIGVSATPDNGYAFSHWATIRGSPVFADSTADSTTVKLNTGDAEIKPCFIPKDISGD